MTFGEIIRIVGKKLLMAIVKVTVFLLWVVTSALEVLLRELNATIRLWLFDKP